MDNNNEYFAHDTHSYMYCADSTFSDYIFALIRDLIADDLKQFSNVFELGAGMGRFSFALVSNFPHIWLIEPSPAYAETITKLFINEYKGKIGGKVTIVNSTMEEFLQNHEVPEKSIVFCFHLLHHLTCEQRKELFTCIARINAPAIFVEPNPFNPLIILQLLVYRDMRMRDEFQYITLTKKKLSREFNSCGLSIVTHDRLCFLPPPVARFALKMPALKKPMQFFDKLRRVIPVMGSYQLFYCKRSSKS